MVASRNSRIQGYKSKKPRLTTPDSRLQILDSRPTTPDSPLRGESGYTFIEIAIVTAIIAILASAVLPLVRVTIQRNREIELRRALRDMRTAIDKYKDAADQNQIANPSTTAEGYPPTLETLVDGVPAANDSTGKKLRYLRRIPRDPMTKGTEWGMRSSRDDPESKSWGGQNVYDVYTKHDGTALDGTKYSEW
jgi:general secretion pathway protein G